jgi:DinB superfamily
MSIDQIAADYQAATREFLSLAKSLKEIDFDRSDAEGWTPRQVIHHVADSEAQSYARLRRLIAEPGTIIQGYDEGKWAESSTLGYTEAPVDSAIAVFEAVREASYLLLLRLSESELDNKGTHSESGEYSIRDWIRSYTNHPTDHAEQIRKQLI